jgi:anthranilate phosphoribosyltransferase
MDVVIANAAFAIQIIENKKPIAECIEIAKNSLYGKKALNALKKFVEINR